MSPIELLNTLERADPLPPVSQVDPDASDWGHTLVTSVCHPGAPVLQWLEALLPYASANATLQGICELVTHPTLAVVGLARLLAHLDPSLPDQRSSLLEALQLLVRTTPGQAFPSDRQAVLEKILGTLGPLSEPEHAPLRLTLSWAAEQGLFDQVYPIVRAYVPAVLNDRALLSKVLNLPADHRTSIEVLADISPDLGGLLLFQALSWGKAAEVSIEQLNDEIYRWPLPVAISFTNLMENLSDLEGEVAMASRQRFVQRVENCLHRPDLSADLKHRLLEGCRPLRPLIAENQFRALDRQSDLAHRPASPGRSRSRS